jgi:transposase
MPIKKRTQEYPADFKTQAVQLAITSGKSRRVVADELGVGMSTLSKWVKHHHRTPNASQTISPISGLTTQQALEQENRRLKRENEVLRQEREILKAATKFFARENQ